MDVWHIEMLGVTVLSEVFAVRRGSSAILTDAPGAAAQMRMSPVSSWAKTLA